MTKVTVFGAGAIGSMLGGLIKLHDPKAELLLIGRGPHGDAIHEQGFVVLEGPWGVHQVPISYSSQVEQAAGSSDLLFTVKSQDTEEAIRSLAPHRGQARLISIQNGITNATILAKVVPVEQLVVGMSATNISIPKPGTVRLNRDGVTLVGSSTGITASPAVEAAACLLRKSGLKIVAHRNVLGVQHNKLAINALGYASVLSQSDFFSEAVLCKEWRETVGLPILDECLNVFRRQGVQLARIPGTPNARSFRWLLWIMDCPFGSIAQQIVRRRFQQQIVWSLQQDLVRRKKTEIDYVNGEIVRLAQACGLEAPRNAKVVELVHELESRGDGSFFSRDEVIQAFRQIG